MVISIKELSGATAADYYLERDAGCEASYYLDPAESAGRWIGAGAAALGLTGLLDEAGQVAFRGLLDGRHPLTDEQLTGPVWRPVPAGRLLGAPLVAALRQRAHERELADPAGLFDDEKLGDAYRGVVSTSERRPFTRALDPRVAVRLGEAAGVDPVAIYRVEDGTDVFTAALARAGDRYDARNAAYDVCVSAPKTVSTLWALADPETAKTVQSAHAKAVDVAVSYLERSCGHGLRGHQGDGRRAARMDTDGFVATAFDHRTSRANDPQLHTHVVIANLLHGRDGKWTAMDSRTLFRHATTASYVYHAVLRGELSTTLGVSWTNVSKGIAEIVGIPTDLAKEFSTRREEIENHLATSGRDDPAATQQACLATRPAKTPLPAGELRAIWEQTARRLGYDAGDIVSATLHRGPVAPIDQARLAVTLTGPRGLTRRKTTVDKRDVIQALCDALPAGTPVTLASLDHLVQEITAGPGIVPLPRGADTGPKLSTAELIASEQHALRLAAALRNTQPICGSGRRLKLDGLTPEQRRLAIRLIFAESSLDVIVGPAGSGKTTALASAYRTWRADHVPVVGTAVAALAARGLQTRTGIPSKTMTQLLIDLDRIDPRTRRPAGFAPGSVVVVDEASMVDTRTFDRLLDHVWRSGARIALVGDTEQLPEIDAGGLFARLAADPSTIRLTTNVRQGEAWERDALIALRENRPAEALLAYLDHGRIHVGESRRLPAAVAAAYIGAAADNPLKTVVLASTRREVAALNTAIRRQLVASGTIDSTGLSIETGDGATTFAAGDVVVVTRNHRELGVLNGMRGQVIDTDPQSTSLTLVDDLGESHVLPSDLLASGDVQHGYALTIHRAQGITVDTALVYGTKALTKEAGYVGLSRGRLANHLYVSPDDVHKAVRDGPFDSDTQSLLLAVEQAATQLAVSRRQQLASSYLPSPSPIDRNGLYPEPAREVRGLSR